MGNYVNHVVICGYDATGDLLLELVDSEIDTDKVRIVVFDNQERPRNVPPHFLWVEGDPTKESELDKVRLTHAQAVIIVGSRATDPQAADARTILTTFTIRAHLEKNADKTKSRHIPLYIVAEVLDAENVEHARAAGADEVVETRRLGFSMLAHTVSFHGTADSMSSVLLSGNYNPYVGQIPSELELPMSYGEVLTTLKLTKRGGLIIAIRDPRSGDVFNPKKDYEIVPGTTLVYLAEGPVLDPP